MEMLIRSALFFLLYLKCRIIYRKQINFRGFSVVCAMKGSNILFSNKGGRKINIFSHPFSNMWRKRSIPTHSEWLYPLTFDAGNGLKEA